MSRHAGRKEAMQRAVDFSQAHLTFESVIEALSGHRPATRRSPGEPLSHQLARANRHDLNEAQNIIYETYRSGKLPGMKLSDLPTPLSPESTRELILH